MTRSNVGGQGVRSVYVLAIRYGVVRVRVQACAAAVRVRTEASVCRSAPTATPADVATDSSATTAKSTPIPARLILVLMTVPAFFGRFFMIRQFF